MFRTANCSHELRGEIGRLLARCADKLTSQFYRRRATRSSREQNFNSMVSPYVVRLRENVMRIAQVAPLTEAVPPRLYGGTERVVSWLTEELVALGHDVTLFASGDSITAAKLASIWPRALRLDGTVRDPNALHIDMIEQVYRRAQEFDIIHCHIDYYPFSLLSRQPTPFVTTLHGRLDLPEHQPVFSTFSRVPVISISDAQRGPVPQANWVATVHHGLPEIAAASAGGQAVLSRLSRPRFAGEGARPRHSYRPHVQSAAEDRGEDRQGRRRVSSNARSRRCSTAPTSSSSARSMTRASRNS